MEHILDEISPCVLLKGLFGSLDNCDTKYVCSYRLKISFLRIKHDFDGSRSVQIDCEKKFAADKRLQSKYNEKLTCPHGFNAMLNKSTLASANPQRIERGWIMTSTKYLGNKNKQTQVLMPSRCKHMTPNVHS